MTTVEFSVEVEAPPARVWVVASDPSNLPHWDRHIVEVRAPEEGLSEGARYEVVMGFLGAKTVVKAEVQEWEPPFRSKVRLQGLLEATVTTSVAPLPRSRSVLRHEISYRFKGPFGELGAASLNAVGGAHMALRRGVLAQKKQVESES